MLDYFPAKLATGVQFCNRVKEKKILARHVAQIRHILLVAPRRYGKSSLVLNMTQAQKLPVAMVDLFLAHSDAAVTKRMLDGVSAAISQIMPRNQKVLAKLQGILNKFRILLGAKGFHIEMSMEKAQLDAVDQIFSALQGLAILAKEEAKPLIFFIDEFQDIIYADSARAIQGAIRHVAQETAHITFIFSGSQRRLLLDIFNDKSKPLYMLCDKMSLERISSQDYEPHLQALAQKNWGKKIESQALERIMALSELHPYYVNLLCHELWLQDHPPTWDEVLDGWLVCYDTHEARLVAELEKLTTKQQDVLKAIALHATDEPTSSQFVQVARMPASSISQAVKALSEKDMIFKIKSVDPLVPQWRMNHLRVLDPLLAHMLRKYS